VTLLDAAPKSPSAWKLFRNVAGPETFNLFSLSLATLVFSLGRLTVYAADQSENLVYSLGAIALSQSLVVVVLALAGKVLFRAPLGKLRPLLVVTVISAVSILGTILFETILRSWNLEPISQSWFQRAITLMFSTFIFLGFGWVSAALDNNFKQVNLGKELITTLSKQQLELSSTIKDARTFAIREVSLEIQSTRGTLDNFVATSTRSHETDDQIKQLQKTLDEVESRVSKISNQFPSYVRIPKINARSRITFVDVVNASTQQNQALPGLISVFAFFGFSSWLSYFLADVNAFVWGTILSASSFVIFWAYEKFLVKQLVAQPMFIRVLVYEVIVISYLFFWLVILGFFAGDNSEAYGAALAYAAIPFVFFNGGAVLGGIVRLSQEHRDNLTTNASSLRKVMAELEQIRSEEDKVWKSLFVGDIALSPTTASVILRDATLTKDHDRVVAAIPNVNALWTSVLLKLPTSA
jgi:hypothetical protein